jgi:hypothetical protein
VQTRPPADKPNTLALVHSNAASINAAIAMVAFDRRELATILNVYGRKVSAGEWRDYAMDFLRDRAMFSIYARVSERPLYIIEKLPKLRNRQGQYSVTSQDGRILRRGHELGQVLRVLDPHLILV